MSVATAEYITSQQESIAPLGGLLDDDADVEDVAPAVVALRVASLVMVALLGVGANVLVALVFYRRPTLRSPSNRFVLSLILANVLTSLIVTPVVLAHQLHRLWWLRQAAAGLTTLAVTASVFSVLAIAVDRYHAVLSPLHYAMTVTRPRSRGMVVGAWGVAVLLALPVLLGATDHACGGATRLLSVGHAAVLASLGFVLPLGALCWIYTRMYKAAHLNNERTRRHSVSTNPGETVSRPGSLEMPLPPKTPLNPPPPRRRCSNASFSTLLFREEGKAVKTAIMVITSFLLCFTPYFATLVLDAWDDHVVPSSARFLALLVALGSGCLTPFIYVFRNEAVRAEALKIMLFWRPNVSQYGNNVSRDFEAYNSSKAAGNGNAALGHTASQRRQSLSYSDSVSVQSFQIPLKIAECRHCSVDPPPPSADFVATYEVMDSPGDQATDLTETKHKEEKPAKVRRESVTFRLAFMPQRRCQTCIRQNSDSSSGSGHPLLRDGEGGGGTPPSQKAAHQRRKRFLAARQGSSADEVSGGSEPNTPKHVIGYVAEANNNANTQPSLAEEAVILELDEPPRRQIPRSPPVVQLQETSLDSSDSAEHPLRQNSESTLRQDSGYSDVTVDSGVVAVDIPSGVPPYQSSIASVCTGGVSLQARRHRPTLQRLAAVEDEGNATETEEISPDLVRNKINKSNFRTRFHRPAFKIPICEI